MPNSTRPVLGDAVVTSGFLGGLVYLAVLKLSQLFSPLLCASYRKLTPKDKIDWDIRWASTVHAIAMTAAACHVILFTRVFSQEEGHTDARAVVFRTTPFTEGALGFSMGYFLVDLTYMLMHPALWEHAMGAHHVAALAAVAAAALRRHAHNYTLALLATECTTPFVNLRWMLEKAGRKGSAAYIANGLLLLAVWFVGRILLLLLFFNHAWKHRGEIAQLPRASRQLAVLVPPLLFALNLLWFYKIVRGACKILLAPPNRQVGGRGGVLRNAAPLVAAGGR